MPIAGSQASRQAGIQVGRHACAIALFTMSIHDAQLHVELCISELAQPRSDALGTLLIPGVYVANPGMTLPSLDSSVKCSDLVRPG